MLELVRLAFVFVFILFHFCTLQVSAATPWITQAVPCLQHLLQSLIVLSFVQKLRQDQKGSSSLLQPLVPGIETLLEVSDVEIVTTCNRLIMKLVVITSVLQSH